MRSRETQITMVQRTNAGGQTKRANERSFVYRPPAWRRWRNVKTTCDAIRMLHQIFSEILNALNVSIQERKSICNGQSFRNVSSVSWGPIICNSDIESHDQYLTHLLIFSHVPLKLSPSSIYNFEKKSISIRVQVVTNCSNIGFFSRT